MHNELYGYERIWTYYTDTKPHIDPESKAYAIHFIHHITPNQFDEWALLLLHCTQIVSVVRDHLHCTKLACKRCALMAIAKDVRRSLLHKEKRWRDLKRSIKNCLLHFFFHFGELKIERKKRQQQHFTRTQLWCSVLCNFIAWMDEWIDRWKRITMVRDAAGAT